MGLEGFLAGQPWLGADPQTDEQITVGSSAAGISPDAMANLATVQVLGANVRMRLVGGDPTATRGTQLAPGDIVTLTGRKTLQSVRFIREGGTDATLEVTYWFFEELTADELTRTGAFTERQRLAERG